MLPSGQKSVQYRVFPSLRRRDRPVEVIALTALYSHVFSTGSPVPPIAVLTDLIIVIAFFCFCLQLNVFFIPL